MTRVEEVEFVALTGCSLSSTIIGYMLGAADRLVNNEVSRLGNPSLDANTLHDASLLLAKALLADRLRFDGTFDVSTTDYSHKGGTEAAITTLRAEAIKLLQEGARQNIMWLQKANR